MLQAKMYKLTEEEKIPGIKNLFGREGLQLIQSYTNSKKEACKTAEGLFYILGEKFKPYHNETEDTMLETGESLSTKSN